MAELKALIQKRGAIKSQLTAFHNFIAKVDQSTLCDTMIKNLELRIKNIEPILDNFTEVQNIIDELETDLDKNMKEREEFQDRYFEYLAFVNNIIDTYNPKVSDQPVQLSISLPPIQLPTFSGNYESWPLFYETFSADIHNDPRIPEIKKFQYLVSSLKSEALDLIAHLNLTTQNYEIAWNLLKESYDNKRLIIKSHVSKLFELKRVSKETSTSLKEILNNLNKHLRALKSLGEPVDSWDSLIIHLATSKLDSKTLRSWEGTIKSSIPPTYAQFETFLREQCNMLEAVESSIHSTVSSEIKSPGLNKTNQKNRTHCFMNLTNNNNSNSNSKIKFNEDNHNIYRCFRFLQEPANSRLRKVKELQLCVNCLKSHKGDCFSKHSCKICGEKHNTLLHQDNIRKDTSDPEKPSTSAAQAVCNFSNNSRNKFKVLLSTSIVRIKDKFGNFIGCRAVLDSGSQLSFITKQLSNKLGLEKHKSFVSVKATRAIHLELVSDLTTSAFIASLRRFMARRGVCSKIYSDNATNFVGAAKELRKLFHNTCTSESVPEQLATEGIEWKFIPARSPHFGGIWEAGVKCIKHHLKRTIGGAILNFEELYTILAQIEAVLNSRPLTILSSSPDDLVPLTPAHFLVGGSLLIPAEEDYTTININRLKRWRMVQAMVQHFWKRWASEFLMQLQQRGKWKEESRNMQVGDIVLLDSTSLPPQNWIIAKVTKIHPGKDGVVRVATVTTSSGKQLTRAVTKLYPLPKEDEA
ncbi:hypothetical protein O3M35_004787 [Rhynocoris fuscipes]|uniref:Integrase catalytic domain-containing protein n=1 Tax=Rhynocoris fuscipes TaxID=488301 RepID=A0AAW1DGE3_9HEMI